MTEIRKLKGSILFYTLSIPSSEGLVWHEEQIVQLLPIGSPLTESVQTACGHFDRILHCVFDSLDMDDIWRSWCVDDFYCEQLLFKDAVATLSGSTHWLSGGSGCEAFTIDVALDTRPLLYSYKLFDPSSGKQSLYVAKTSDEWHFSA